MNIIFSKDAYSHSKTSYKRGLENFRNQRTTFETKIKRFQNVIGQILLNYL